ncbi:N(G),N(G)-dimethylarginine dimethylaminohydrolase [Actinotalea ferrariae]|uniref:dimethylargininase n=1 Tax=Actinotalea ferrariae TaxID=1386098 RepID=UPI001C8BE662|nr:dimethylargininase [Actinotalea ferrariae]MBX9244981.1 N(G),N(G)-dimethylarginine dimethylaminohydrolase [Actinotalea ferrariae]
MTAATRHRLLVRRPSPGLADGELTHLERWPVDLDLARRQWDAYVEVFVRRGWEVHEVEASDEHPDGVFVEDTVVVLGTTALLAEPGVASRRGEAAGTARAVARLGLDVLHVTPPATLEGGDVLELTDGTVYVGRGTRTNDAGVAQLAALAGDQGRTVVAVPVTRALHLKTAVTALPDDTVIGHEDLVDDPSVFPSYLPVPEREGTAVVVLDDETVLLSESAPATAALLRDRGLDVVTTPVSEFEKLEGCVTCLSVRIR